MPLLMAITVAFGLSLALTAVLCRTSARLARLDYPNERSLHDHPRPRTGGLAVLAAGALCADFLWLQAGTPGEPAWVGLGAGLVAAVSFLDDRADVPPLIRLGVHFLAAGLVAWSGFVLLEEDGPHRYLLAGGFVLALVWMTNLYNFMDGMDGFAGGMTVVAFTAFAWLAARAGADTLSTVSAAWAAAAAGFLVFNFPPARIFMGDAGASTIGFILGVLALSGVRRGLWTWPAALLVLSPFVVDATVTLVGRLVKGERVWQPHRRHFYQRLVRAGWGHRRTVLLEYALMIGCAATAVVWSARGADSWTMPLVVWGMVYLVFIAFVLRVERAGAEARPGSPPRAALPSQPPPR